MSNRTGLAWIFARCLSLVALLAPACKDHPSPAPGPAPVDSVAENARDQHFESELERAHALWQERPDLGKCAELLLEKSDAELCPAASSALLTLAALDAAAPPDRALPVLGSAAVALARLRDRARYLSFDDIRHRRLGGDGGLPAPTSDSAHPASAQNAPASSSQRAALQHSASDPLRASPAFALADSPLSVLVQNTSRLEQGVLRHLGAYLEYAALPVRRQAFATAKGIRAEHPRWPALNHVLREAELLETDRALKHDLSELANLVVPRRDQLPDQPTGSK